MEELNNAGTTAEDLEQVGSDQQGDNPGGSGAEQQEPKQKERTFSQEDVDKIVQKRLAKERAKIAEMLQVEEKSNDLDERERKITERELKADAREKLDAAGLPRSLGELLKYDSPEALEDSFKQVSAAFRASLGESLKASARQDTPRDGMGYSGQSAALAKAFGLKR